MGRGHLSGLAGRPLTVDSLCCLALLGLAVLLSSQVWSSPIRWTPDGLAFQAKLLQDRGVPRPAAISQAFLLAPNVTPLNGRAALTTEAKLAYNMRWYRRRILVPAIGARVWPVFGLRSLLTVSLAAYVLLAMALYIFLRLRFAPPYAAGATALTLLFPPLRRWSFDPLSDSAGLLWVVFALTAAVLTVRSSRWWLIPWVGVLAAGSLTRESIVVPVVAAGILAARRAPRAFPLLVSGLLAIAPAMILLRFPFERAFAEAAARQFHDRVDMTSLGLLKHWATLAGRLPLWEFVNEPIWTSVLVGALAMIALSSDRSVPARVARSSAVAGAVYLLSFPFFTGLRLEFVLIPAASYGLALLAEDAVLAVRKTRSACPTPSLGFGVTPEHAAARRERADRSPPSRSLTDSTS
jgi:hypothetical protein